MTPVLPILALTLGGAVDPVPAAPTPAPERLGSRSSVATIALETSEGLPQGGVDGRPRLGALETGRAVTVDLMRH